MFSSSYLEITETILPMAREAMAIRPRPTKTPRVKEKVVHSIWLEQPWAPYPIRDVKGKSVEIISPGWINGSFGPDFRSALFRYDGGDVEKGDVEIHVHSSDWVRHKHQKDPAYNSTRLHVALYCDSTANPRVTQAGRALIEIDLEKICFPVIDKTGPEPLLNPGKARLDDVTGKCADELARLGDVRTGELLDAAGDARCQIKAQRYGNAGIESKGERALYSGLLETLGYRVFRSQFTRLSRIVTLEFIRDVMEGVDHRKRPIILQGVLLGMAGFVPETGVGCDNLQPESREYFGHLRQAWGAISARHGLSPVLNRDQWPLAGARPANYPMGRLAGLAHFLSEHGDSDMEVMLDRVIHSFPLDGGARARKEWADKTVSLFPSPPDDYWVWRYVVGGKKLAKPRKLIGRERIGLFMVNIVIPFFLARARGRENREEEIYLGRVYHQAPKPSPNSVSRFMIERLFHNAKCPAGFIDMAREQGLMQIYNDFCAVNPGGCHKCAFLSYLEKLSDEGITSDQDKSPSLHR